MLRALLDRAPEPRPGADRRRRSSATPTAPARTTATSPGWPCCSPGCPTSVPGDDRQPALRLQPGRRDARRRRAIETGDADDRRRRRRRVDDPGAVGAAQARRGPSRPATRRCLDDARLAAGQPADAGGVDGLARRGQRAAGRRATASPASAQDAFAARSHRLAARGLGRRLLRRPGRAGARHRARRATRASAPTPAPETLAGLKPAFRADGTITAGNASPLNDGAAARAARLARPPPPRWARAAGPDRRPRRRRASTRSVFGIAPGRGRRTGRWRGPASAGPTSARSSSTRRSPRSRWPASTRGGSTPTIVNTRGGAIAIGHPLGASGARHPRHAGRTAARRRAALGRRRDLHRRRPGARRRARGLGEARCQQTRPASCRATGATQPASHPPLTYPGYASSALRGTRPPVELRPPADRGHRAGARARSRVGPARPRPHPPARRRAARPADHRPRPGARRRRPPGAATRWSRSGRPTRPAATGTSVDNWPAPLDPNFTGVGRALTDDQGRYGS